MMPICYTSFHLEIKSRREAHYKSIVLLVLLSIPHTLSRSFDYQVAALCAKRSMDSCNIDDDDIFSLVY